MSLEVELKKTRESLLAINSSLVEISQALHQLVSANQPSNVGAKSGQVSVQKPTRDQVREALNEVVRKRGKNVAVKLLASFHEAKTIDDLLLPEYASVIARVKSVLGES